MAVLDQSATSVIFHVGLSNSDIFPPDLQQQIESLTNKIKETFGRMGRDRLNTLIDATLAQQVQSERGTTLKVIAFNWGLSFGSDGPYHALAPTRYTASVDAVFDSYPVLKGIFQPAEGHSRLMINRMDIHQYTRGVGSKHSDAMCLNTYSFCKIIVKVGGGGLFSKAGDQWYLTETSDIFDQ